jgi:2-C-methyl-D-erythritol 4-phosphate cytidylyltransferase
LRRIQTPQGFQLAVLRNAHAAGPVGEATDDAALVEALGRSVRTVPGDEAAFKITTPHDLRLAELLVTG